jgi:single-strand DNA-binding protein
VTIWWRVTIWDEQFKNMLPHMKKGSAVMVFGEVQKPEIFTDREGKPQISMDITAIQLQFSPFGKPGGAQGGAQPNDVRSSAPAGNAPFGHFSDSMPNPYMGGSPAAPQSQGSTFDDEVPF